MLASCAQRDATDVTTSEPLQSGSRGWMFLLQHLALTDEKVIEIATSEAAGFDALLESENEAHSVIKRTPIDVGLQELTKSNNCFLAVRSHDLLSLVFGVSSRNGTEGVIYLTPCGSLSFAPRTTLRQSEIQQCWIVGVSQSTEISLDGNTKVAINKRWHCFGEVIPGSKIETEFHVSNLSAHPIQLVDPIPSCGCTVVGIGKKTDIPPGESLTVPITMSTGENKVSSSVAFSLLGEDPSLKKSLVFSLFGTFKECLSFSPNRLDFGSIRPDIDPIEPIYCSSRILLGSILHQINWHVRFPIGPIH